MAKGVNFTFRATNAAKAAMGDFQRGLKGVQKETQRTQALQRSWNRGLNSNRRAVQQFGFQMTDFAVQVSGGQSAMLAFTQQGGQMLQFFGPFGAIAAAVLAVFGSLAIAFTRSGKALSDLTPLAGVTASQIIPICPRVLWRTGKNRRFSEPNRQTLVALEPVYLRGAESILTPSPQPP